MVHTFAVALCALVLGSGCPSVPPAPPPHAPPVAEEPARADDRPDDRADPRPSAAEARAAYEALLVRRADPDYYVSDTRVAEAIERLQDADPARVARAKALLAEKAAADEDVARAEREVEAAADDVGRMLEARLEVDRAKRAQAEVAARLEAALQAL